jgi:hypothetical protein
MNENEVGGTHNTYSGNEIWDKMFLKNLKSKDHLGDLSVDGRICEYLSLS